MSYRWCVQDITTSSVATVEHTFKELPKHEIIVEILH